eukprot:GHVU01006841.1.p3 GENE.GHVU01006841.1~~GHVU01006841.1.p3  ORF type:complete len:124 (+),score=12.11 GHVU01006841.1:192-563(+)
MRTKRSPSRSRQEFEKDSRGLVLCSDPQRISIDLKEEERTGKAPFPVISMPISFMKTANKNREKQERIERHYRFSVNVPNANIDRSGSDASVSSETAAAAASESSRENLVLRITEQTSFDLDK